jgi:hypothetical protein
MEILSRAEKLSSCIDIENQFYYRQTRAVQAGARQGRAAMTGRSPEKKHAASSQEYRVPAETQEGSHGFGNQHGQCREHD